jgi:hypothetical protein
MLLLPIPAGANSHFSAAGFDTASHEVSYGVPDSHNIGDIKCSNLLKTRELKLGKFGLARLDRTL